MGFEPINPIYDQTPIKCSSACFPYKMQLPLVVSSDNSCATPAYNLSVTISAGHLKEESVKLVLLPRKVSDPAVRKAMVIETACVLPSPCYVLHRNRGSVILVPCYYSRVHKFLKKLTEYNVRMASGSSVTIYPSAILEYPTRYVRGSIGLSKSTGFCWFVSGTDSSPRWGCCLLRVKRYIILT